MALGAGITVRSGTTGDQGAVDTLTAAAFGGRADAGRAERRARLWEAEAAIVAEAGGRVVGHVRSRDMEVTVPGERQVAACGIAGVAVAPTHRRRGILRAMYEEQHERIEAAGLPLTIFTASEATIYGRFGYGPAVRENSVRIDRRFAEFRPTAPDPGGVDLVDPGDAEERIRALYDRWRRLTPAAQERPDASWGNLFADPPAERDGGSELFTLLHPDGYAIYRYHHDESAMNVRVDEFRAVTGEAHAALWRALLGLDLVTEVRAAIGDNDPLPYLLTDSRLVRTRSRHDSLWLRLMDVPAALTARAYRRDLDLTLAVTDPFREAGGTFALRVRDGHAECAPTGREPDVETGIDVLASLYFGAYPARVFAAADRLRAKDIGFVHELEEAFGWDRDAELGWFF